MSHHTKTELSRLQREEIERIAGEANQVFQSEHTKSDFRRDIKHIWKTLFPERDEKGRPDETIVPYVVKHLTGKRDRSREKRRDDIITFAQFEALLQYFRHDAQIQAFLTFALESLGRPQETLYTRIKDYEWYDNYAIVYLSSHTKEGLEGV